MSHRALVAHARGDGQYDVYYAHDGGADDRLARLRCPDARSPPSLLDGPLLARGRSFEAVLADHLDPVEHEALLVVEGSGVEPFVVLPYVLATAAGLLEGEPRGVAISLAADDGCALHPAFVRGWFQGTAGTIGEAVDAGVLSTAEAFEWLDAAVRRFAGDRHRSAVLP